MNKNQILVFGDICPTEDYRRFFDTRENGALSDRISSDVSAAGLAIANFECPATEHAVPIAKCGPSLRAEPKDVQLLRRIGFDVLSLANNHILDFGAEGVMQTLELCGAAQILTVGAGENCDAAKRPLLFEQDGKKIAILSYAEVEFNLAGKTTPGANHFEPFDAPDEIRRLRSGCDYLIVLYHGGIEHYKYPSPMLQKKCRKLAEAGADLVLCQHSHCIGTIEKRGGSTILYGQGNAVFGYREGNTAWNEGLVVKVDLHQPEKVDLLLLKATADGVEYANEEECAERLQTLKKDSERLNDAEWIEQQWIAYCKRQEALDLPMLFGRSRVFNKLNRLLGNRLIRLLYSKRKMMTTMNLLRCEAHHEVVQTILEENVFEKDRF